LKACWFTQEHKKTTEFRGLFGLKQFGDVLISINDEDREIVRFDVNDGKIEDYEFLAEFLKKGRNPFSKLRYLAVDKATGDMALVDWGEHRWI
jgi:hypothetical protein